MFTGHLVALITPFRNGAVDYQALEAILQQHAESTDGVVLLGTTGERASLTLDEQKNIIQAVVKQVNGCIPVIVGTGCNCTGKSVEMTKVAQSLGADGCLVVIPYYNKPPLRGILAHYAAIAGVGLPVIAYHHPGRTGVRLEVNEWQEVLAIEGVVALKEASGDLELAKTLIDAGTSILCGDDHLTCDMMKMGAAGTISVIGNVIPAHWTKMVHACKAGKIDEAKALFASCQELLEALSAEVNPIPIKCAVHLAGLCENELRLPLVPALQAVQEQISRALLAFNRCDESIELIR